MASIFIRQINKRPYFSIYGANPIRLDSKTVKSNQVYLGKIVLPDGNMVLNDQFFPWVEKHSLTLNYICDKLYSESKKHNINIIIPEYLLKDNANLNHDNNNNPDISAPKSSINITIDDLKASKKVFYGHIYLLNYLSDILGLTSILKECFSKQWKTILTLAQYFAVECAPAMYCSNWAKKVDCLSQPSLLTSQRINELFHSIDFSSTSKFYDKWTKIVVEDEFIALDNTSVSTYSENISNAAYRYDYDYDNLERINVCLLFGKKSGLPIYSSLYHGSLSDIKTLKSTISQFNFLNDTNYTLVMDEDFYSTENINFMLSMKPQIKFNISIPKTINLFNELVKDSVSLIGDYDSILITPSGIMLGYTKMILWDNNKKLYAHICINMSSKLYNEHVITYNIIDMLTQASDDPCKYMDNPIYNSVLSFNKLFKSESGYIVKIKNNIIKRKTINSGVMILVTNYIKDIDEAINQFTKKTVVDKAFNNLKDYKLLKKEDIHSYKNFYGKSFICFISLILLSKVNKIMISSNLYVKYTMKELFNELSLLEKMYFKGYEIIMPVTEEQKHIFKYFSCPIPSETLDFNSGTSKS
ncbi:MAG: hypothetical protein LBR11_01770 [Deltaproteobacteria bacterium]|nr:hypothetical protein [Deltaproteobacteria bacterium]